MTIRLCVLLVVTCCCWDANVAAKSPPNIVIIYADDLGYGDVQCYNTDRGRIATPNIDRVASQGMRFTDGTMAPQVIILGRKFERIDLVAESCELDVQVDFSG